MCRSLTVVAAAFLVLAGDAAADSVGAFHFVMPTGWAVCPTQDFVGYHALCPATGAARIGIRSPVAGPDAATLARTEVVGEVLKDSAVAFVGEVGHLVVSQNERVIAVAAASTAGGGVVVVLIASAAEAPATVHVWGALVDGATLADDGADDGAEDGAEDGPAVEPEVVASKVTLRLTNIAADCEATVYVDGVAIAIPPGGARDLEITAGSHVFEWQDSAGVQRSARAEAPPVASLGGGCTAGVAAPEQPQPTVQPKAAPLPENAGRRAIIDGARAAVQFYRGCWSLISGGELEPPPRSLDRLALKLVARKPQGARGQLVVYTRALAALTDAAQRTAGVPDARRQLRHAALLFLASAAQMPPAPVACRAASATQSHDEKLVALDCMLRYVESRPPVENVDGMNTAFLRLATADPPSPKLLSRLPSIESGWGP